MSAASHQVDHRAGHLHLQDRPCTVSPHLSTAHKFHISSPRAIASALPIVCMASWVYSEFARGPLSSGCGIGLTC